MCEETCWTVLRDILGTFQSRRDDNKTKIRAFDGGDWGQKGKSSKNAVFCVFFFSQETSRQYNFDGANFIIRLFRVGETTTKQKFTLLMGGGDWGQKGKSGKSNGGFSEGGFFK